MKKIIKLTESDLTNIIKRVIKESNFRAKFNDTEHWIDQDNKYFYPDKDLEATGYYDFDYDPYTEVEDFEEIPDDIRNKLFQKEIGKEFYNRYKEKFGKFKYSRGKEY